jgi:hypothetical protein
MRSPRPDVFRFLRIDDCYRRKSSEKASRIAGGNDALLEQTNTREFRRDLEAFCDFSDQSSAIEGAFRQCGQIQIPVSAELTDMIDERAKGYEQGATDESGLPLHPVALMRRDDRIACASIRLRQRLRDISKQGEIGPFFALEDEIVKSGVAVGVGEDAAQPIFETGSLHQPNSDLYNRLASSLKLNDRLDLTRLFRESTVGLKAVDLACEQVPQVIRCHWKGD